MSRSYPVGIAGESFYQEAIGCCAVGDTVQIFWESDNPHGRDALVCYSRDRRIGHVPEENWLMAAVYEDGYACEAFIKAFNEGQEFVGVVLDVSTVSGPIAQIAYSHLDRPLPKGCLRFLF